jgi:hypothetical protein
VTKFRYLGMILATQTLIHKEIKISLNFGNACCHSVQHFFVFPSAI